MMPVLERQIAGMLRDHFEIVDGSTGSVTVLRLLIMEYVRLSSYIYRESSKFILVTSGK